MNIKFLNLFVIFLINYGCSNPQPCPELVFDENDKVTYVDDKPYTGRCLVSYGEKTRSIQQYLNGADHGKWTFYFENGETETKGQFKNGIRVGVWRYYYPNGKIRQKSRYSNEGERKGKWSSYDSIGNIISSKKY